MMLVPAGIKVHMAVGYTDLRKGLDGRRRSTSSCCRRQMFSITKDARDLKQATITHPTHRSTDLSPVLFLRQEMTAVHGQAESLVLEILRPTGWQQCTGIYLY
jgi:hypothetical protein